MNDDWKWSKSNSKTHDWQGECSITELHSYHPIWRLIYNIGQMRRANGIKESIKETESFANTCIDQSKVSAARFFIQQQNDSLKKVLSISKLYTLTPCFYQNSA
jgi:hypothetical protein